MPRWNLNDAAVDEGGSRVYAMPVAEPLPGASSTAVVDAARYSAQYIPGGEQQLLVTIADTDGFPEHEANLPSPSIRLHAMAPGWLSIDVTHGDPRLVIESPRFPLMVERRWAPWYELWGQANVFPERIIYGNIDLAWVAALVHPLRAGGSTPHGLQLPSDIDPAHASAYVDNFLTGSSPIVASPFAVIGAAGPFPATGSTDRQFWISSRYTRNRSMHPRELFNLLFWNESADDVFNLASVSPYFHPLLQALQAQPGTRLRPPLRSWKRAHWEARQEVVAHPANWATAGQLVDGTGTTLLEHPNIQNDAALGFYNNMNKCNIFVSEICIRAGFKAVVYVPNRRYMQANSLAMYGVDDGLAIDGAAILPGGTLWGRKRSPAFRQAFLAADAVTAVSETMQALNDLIAEQGRVVLLAIQRRDVDAAGARRSGHVVIVSSITDASLDPVDADGDADLYEVGTVTAQVIEAAGGGAREGTFVITDLARFGFNYDLVSLIEIVPGGDPTEPWGIAELTVGVP